MFVWLPLDDFLIGLITQDVAIFCRNNERNIAQGPQFIRVGVKNHIFLLTAAPNEQKSLHKKRENNINE